MVIDVSAHPRYSAADLDVMLDLWVKHLREPGAWNGDILIITNRFGFSHAEVETVKIDSTFERIYDAQIVRVLKHHLVPSRDYDSILYLDLDILAVDAIHTLLRTTSTCGSHPRTYEHFLPSMLGPCWEFSISFAMGCCPQLGGPSLESRPAFSAQLEGHGLLT